MRSVEGFTCTAERAATLVCSSVPASVGNWQDVLNGIIHLILLTDHNGPKVLLMIDLNVKKLSFSKNELELK